MITDCAGAVVRFAVILDSIDVDDDFAVVRASPPRDTTELRRAEEGVWVSVEVGCE